MSFKQLILRNLKKNIKNYYLYVFALIFSVALYFSFVTLQYDPAMDAASGSIKGEAAMRTASVMLIVIVTVFLIYANNLFIKRRSKEIGLFQLVGMTKGNIFQVLSLENIMLYFGSMFVGIFLGFASSKLIMMILLKLIGIDEVAELRFSSEALVQTVIVFGAIYLLIMLMNGLYIKRQRLLTLFHATSISEEKRHKVSVVEIIIGLLGLGLIVFGYYLSTQLFNGNFKMMEQMFTVMLIILASVILGTYFFYKGSIRFIFHVIRKKNNGYLSIYKVLSLSSIMFRMRSNSFLLTVITTVSALAIGLMALSYISYYSAEKSAEESVPNHFSIPNVERATQFTNELEENDIEFSRVEFDILSVNADYREIMVGQEELKAEYEMVTGPMVVVSDALVEGIDVTKDDSVFVNSNKAMDAFLTFEPGKFTLAGKEHVFELNFKGVKDKRIIPLWLSNGGFPVAVVDNEVYQQLEKDKDDKIQGEYPVYVGVDIIDNGELERANEIFHELDLGKWAAHESRLDNFQHNKQFMGLTMFISGFLGLAFLITSGCILYFKQMDEGEEEKGNYTILRKVGFTRADLLNGIKVKQIFNFGIPLVVGLCHSYFAVKSGWFFFGTEMWTPMIIVMVFYTLLYSVFGILSVLYYKKIIREAL